MAVAMAHSWHMHQRYGGGPYTDHLRAVRDVLLEFGVDQPYMLCAAWLHDILEDTDCPPRLIAKVFGNKVLDIVWCVTGYGANRIERAAHLYDKLGAFYNRDPYIVKCADRIANMRAAKDGPLEQMYLKAWPDFKQYVVPWVSSAMQQELLRLHEARATDRSGNPPGNPGDWSEEPWRDSDRQAPNNS